MSEEPCAHDWSIPLYGSTGDDYSDEVVGWCCSRCFRQVFPSEETDEVRTDSQASTIRATVTISA